MARKEKRPSWQRFDWGDVVEVTRPTTDLERSLVGQRLVFQYYTEPSKLAVVAPADQFEAWQEDDDLPLEDLYLHPESLNSRVSGDWKKDANLVTGDVPLFREIDEDVDTDWTKVALVALGGIGLWLLFRRRAQEE